MPCGCHKTTANPDATPMPVQGRVRPFDQCAACAQKHLATAIVLLREHSYETENRMAILGNLRAVVDHTSRRWPNIADLARECAHIIQQFRDDDALIASLRTLANLIENAQFDDDPKTAARAAALRQK